MKKILLSTTFFISVIANAQVGINTDSPNESSVLDIESPNKGVLLPRLENADNITNPAAGLIIYNKAKKTLQINIGTPEKPDWRDVSLKSKLIADLKCPSLSAHGVFSKGVALTSENYLSINVDVTELSEEPSENNYTIETNEVNGYKFSASGTFDAIGEKTINLVGSGTPTNGGTDNFTLTFKGISCNQNIEVAASQPKTIVVGNENSDMNKDGIPAYFKEGTNNDSWSATIYDKSQIGTSGTITSISYKIDGADSSCSDPIPNQRVYMKLVDDDRFNDDSPEDTSGKTEVFNGTVTWVKVNGQKKWTDIKLDTPFEYDNTKNLLVYFVNKSGNQDTCLDDDYWGGPNFVADAHSDRTREPAKYKKTPTQSRPYRSKMYPVIKLVIE